MDIVSVFVLDLNRSDDTINCVNTVLAYNRDIVRVHILINGSQSEHGERIHAAFADDTAVNIVNSEVNLGFAGGMNLLLRTAQAAGVLSEYILLLNNDAVIEKDTISLLLTGIKNNKAAGIAGPRILNTRAPEHIVEDGVRLWHWIMQHSPINYAKDPAACKPGMPMPMPLVHGTCMLIRTELMRQLAGFDECFFAYFEDWDLCFRVRRAGYDIIHVPAARAHHYGAATTGKGSLTYQFLMTRNRFLIARKHLSLPLFLLVFFPYFALSRVLLKGIILLYNGHTQGIKGICLALVWLSTPGQYKARLWPIANSVCPDSP